MRSSTMLGRPRSNHHDKESNRLGSTLPAIPGRRFRSLRLPSSRFSKLAVGQSAVQFGYHPSLLTRHTFREESRGRSNPQCAPHTPGRNLREAVQQAEIVPRNTAYARMVASFANRGSSEIKPPGQEIFLADSALRHWVIDDSRRFVAQPLTCFH